MCREIAGSGVLVCHLTSREFVVDSVLAAVNVCCSSKCSSCASASLDGIAMRHTDYNQQPFFLHRIQYISAYLADPLEICPIHCTPSSWLQRCISQTPRLPISRPGRTGRPCATGSAIGRGRQDRRTRVTVHRTPLVPVELAMCVRIVWAGTLHVCSTIKTCTVHTLCIEPLRAKCNKVLLI